jgi:hypothetical protein
VITRLRGSPLAIRELPRGAGLGSLKIRNVKTLYQAILVPLVGASAAALRRSPADESAGELEASLLKVCPCSLGHADLKLELSVAFDRDQQHMTSERLGLYGQANKRTWWMPRRQKAMKDVAACDKPRGAGKQASIRGFLNGETHRFTRYPCLNT